MLDNVKSVDSGRMGDVNGKKWKEGEATRLETSLVSLDVMELAWSAGWERWSAVGSEVGCVASGW